MRVLSGEDEKLLQRLVSYAGDSTIVDEAIETLGRNPKGYSIEELVAKIDELIKEKKDMGARAAVAR